VGQLSMEIAALTGSVFSGRQQNVLQPDGAPVAVIDFTYPKGVPSGFSYNPKTYEDDIGLVYLKQPVKTKPVPLHGGSPTWEDINAKRLSLTFVGFGYDVVDEQKFGSGIKREASWSIDAVENRRVLFRVPGKNTCKGDSGGPAFYPIAGKRVQLAVTSGGDPDCTTGFETRVDVFLPWLEGQIR
jgi:secreted trypsin-like serine protease